MAGGRPSHSPVPAFLSSALCFHRDGRFGRKSKLRANARIHYGHAESGLLFDELACMGLKHRFTGVRPDFLE